MLLSAAAIYTYEMIHNTFLLKDPKPHTDTIFHCHFVTGLPISL